ncbi:Lrp/AsnC family transcriptional regulator [Agrococcus sp. ProA11]|uniref:Lrp/AsnC family transcriptional regulator n=1 Tax=Agrococcus chionoecetis TaxID=3153752 RepID=UPI00326170C7
MDLDAALVRALQDDGRASISELATRLGHPRAVVSARVRRLLAEGEVRVIAAVDPSFLRQHVLAHLSVQTDGAVGPVGAQLRSMPDTVLVSAVGGTFDIVAELRVGSMPELQDRLGQIRDLPGVASVSTLVYTTVIKGFFVSEYRGAVTLDDTDVSLIELLQRDGRMSYRALGDAVRLSASAVTTRVHRLISRGVIKISAVETRGLAHRQLSMGVGLSMRGNDERMIEALRESRGVDFATRTVGRFDLVATLVQPSAGDLYASLERIRADPGVERIESWLHLAVLKEDYTRSLRPARS